MSIIVQINTYIEGMYFNKGNNFQWLSKPSGFSQVEDLLSALSSKLGYNSSKIIYYPVHYICCISPIRFVFHEPPCIFIRVISKTIHRVIVASTIIKRLSKLFSLPFISANNSSAYITRSYQIYNLLLGSIYQTDYSKSKQTLVTKTKLSSCNFWCNDSWKKNLLLHDQINLSV